MKTSAEAPQLPPGCRCRKLKGNYIPQSCHVINGRKQTCKDLIFPETDIEEISQVEIDTLLNKLL